MATGIRIYNTHGSVQIDETYRNLLFVERRAIPISLDPGTGIQTIDIPITGSQVVVALQCIDFYPFLFNVGFSGGVWTYRYRFTRLDPPSSPYTGTAYLYIFDWGTPPAGQTTGLKIFDAAGSLCFSSEMKPLKIAAILPASNSFTGTPGRTYVPLILQASVTPVNTGGVPAINDFSYSLRATANQIISEFREMGGGFIGYNSDGVYAAVDVSHFV